MNGSGGRPFAGRALIAVAVAAGVTLLLLLLWYAADLLLLVFAGVLVSSLLRGLSRWLRKRLHLSAGVSLLLVVLGLLALGAGLVRLVAGQIGAQAGELQKQLPQAVEHLMQQITQWEWARDALQSLPSAGEWFARRGGTAIQRFTGLASATLGAVVNAVLIIVFALYLASQPELYGRGLLRLVPMRHRARAGEVLGAIDGALWRWLIGRFGLMLLNAAFTSAGLWLLGVPFFLTLGLLAGVLNFIPNIGPLIAAIPAVLIGLMQGPWQGLYVALLYLVLQGVDGYVMTPLVDRRSVRLPPVLTVTAQVLFGAAFGFLGLLLASPLATTAMIIVRMAYVEDLLGDRGEEGP